LLLMEMEKFYDVMCSESYDWWILAFAFDTDKDTIKKISFFKHYNHDDSGVHVYSIENRIIIYIFCKMEFCYLSLDENRPLTEYKEIDSLLMKLLIENRDYLKNGDYRLLFAVMLESGFLPSTNDTLPFSSQEMKNLPKAMGKLLSLIVIE
jgi:hypothetical protein